MGRYRDQIQMFLLTLMWIKWFMCVNLGLEQCDGGGQVGASA